VDDLPWGQASSVGVGADEVEVELVEGSLGQELGAAAEAFQVVELIFAQAVDGFDVTLVGMGSGRDALAKAEQEARFLDEAAQRELEGDKQTAELILNAATELPAPEALPDPIPVVPVGARLRGADAPKVEALTFTTTWKWEVTDIAQVPRQHMKLDESATGAVVRALKDKTAIPGVLVYREQVTVKSRR